MSGDGAARRPPAVARPRRRARWRRRPAARAGRRRAWSASCSSASCGAPSAFSQRLRGRERGRPDPHPRRLNTEADALRDEIGDAQAPAADLADVAAATTRPRPRRPTSSWQRSRCWPGTVPVDGPGLAVTDRRPGGAVELRHPHRPRAGAARRRRRGDRRQRPAGSASASAFAEPDERDHRSTATRSTPPYRVAAIGQPATLEAGSRSPAAPSTRWPPSRGVRRRRPAAPRSATCRPSPEPPTFRVAAVRVGSRPMNVPEDLRYTPTTSGSGSRTATVRIGITDYAQDALGDVVFVAAPRASAPTVEAGGIVQRGRVDQVGVRHLRPGRRARSSRSTPTGRRPPAAQRGSLRRGLDLRDRARPTPAALDAPPRRRRPTAKLDRVT